MKDFGFWLTVWGWVLAGIVFLMMQGCVVVGDYAPQVNASIGTGGAQSSPHKTYHPHIADDLQK